MDLIIKEIEALSDDVYTIVSKAKDYKDDIQRGVNVNHTPKWDDSITKQDKINNLFYYLDEAKNDMDTIRDDLKELNSNLQDLLELVSYEQIAQKIRA